MKILALLSWYRENPSWLQRCILSLGGLCDELVAVDGPYALFPDDRPRSTAAEYEAINQACHGAGIRPFIVSPGYPWKGGEVEKRTYMFDFAFKDAEPNRDWYMVVDADVVVEGDGRPVREILASTTFDVGQVDMVEPQPEGGDAKRFSFPMFFRAIEGLHVAGNHFTYRLPDGTNLWGNALSRRLAPRVPLPLTVLHRTHERSRNRREKAKAYYHQRDKVAKIEEGFCDRCDAPAVRHMQGGFHPGQGGHVSSWTDLCALHARDMERENAEYRARHGLLGAVPLKQVHVAGPAPQ